MKKRLSLLLALLFLANARFAAAQNEVLIPNVSKKDRICFALYTTQSSILKITVQFYPLEKDESREVILNIKKDGGWKQVAQTKITEDKYGNKAKDRTWTAHFRIEDWDDTHNFAYQVSALDGVAKYEGLIRRDPKEKNEIVIAAFTGNSIYAGHGGDIPRTDLVENIKKLNPDLLFFSGDQVYDHTHHLGYWLRFGRDFGEVIRNTPTITIPDDHDVGQANLWGAHGKKAKFQHGSDGGYFMPASYVKAVERAQTWHLPDAFDPTPIQQGIGTYYTNLTLGRISFAILEDRKFKSGPMGLVPKQGPRPDHILNPNYDPKSIDLKNAVLLGERQLAFLNTWGKDWHGADMKVVLSQTIFCGGAHIHGKAKGRLHADLDSNGWPQTGRNKALDAMRRCFAVHIAGDQHLATIFQHGIDDWNDAGYSFCVPSIANLYLRWWSPEKADENRPKGTPEYTGRHLDGFGNRVTCWAAANPSKKRNNGDKLTTRAAGFGIIRFNKPTREITFECWPRNTDIQNPNAKQYPGWPKTIKQSDNYGRKAAAYLPTLKIQGQTNPVVQIIDESNSKVIYTLRISRNSFRPKVFKKGTYTIKIGEGKNLRVLHGIKSWPPEKTITLNIVFD